MFLHDKWSYWHIRLSYIYVAHSKLVTLLGFGCRTRRKGFAHYVIGQLKSIGMKFYNTDLHIDIIQVTEEKQQIHTIFQVELSYP